MAYDVTLVQFTGPLPLPSIAPDIISNLQFGSDSPYDNLLISWWTCNPGTFNLGVFTNTIFFFDPVFFEVSSSQTITVELFNVHTVNQQIYSARYQAPTHLRWNFLLSVNAASQTVQLYCNDVPLTPTSGGWIASNSLRGLGQLGIFAGNFGNVFPAVADVWMELPDSFVDLSIEANRRKFINADLTPVFLGDKGTEPFGTQPPLYLTVPAGGVPNDLLTNYGTGGSFRLTTNPPGTLTFQAAGTCAVPIPVLLTGVSASAQVGSLSFPTSIWAITSKVQTPSPGAVGDVWADDSYIDFSDPSVRANFENADGSWLNLGYNGATPTGSSPLLYLTVQLQQPPSNILTGYGQGGAQTHWALLDQGTNPVTGQAYPAMSFDACVPPSGNLELTDIEVIATSPTIPDNEVTLRWSDDAGASWSNGLLRSMGQAGEYFTAPTWYRLGMSRNRILELSWSGARAEALQGVFVEVTISAT